jgi:hypothetical protein
MNRFEENRFEGARLVAQGFSPESRSDKRQ